jgi:hypothetical protein
MERYLWESIHRANEEDRAEKEAAWEKNKEFWLRAREQDRIEKEEKHKSKMIRRQESEERWNAYCANQLRTLKELNHKESEGRYGGHLLTHPDEVAATLASGVRSPMDDHILSERACEDDYHTTTANGSEGHFLTHPSKGAATLTGGVWSPMDDHTLPEINK